MLVYWDRFSVGSNRSLDETVLVTYPIPCCAVMGSSMLPSLRLFITGVTAWHTWIGRQWTLALVDQVVYETSIKLKVFYVLCNWSQTVSFSCNACRKMEEWPYWNSPEFPHHSVILSLVRQINPLQDNVKKKQWQPMCMQLWSMNISISLTVGRKIILLNHIGTTGAKAFEW